MYNGQFGVQSDGNGLYYMRTRYYNVDIKRFINQDILTGTIDSSQSLNRYAYVEGNPVSFLDPFGLCSDKVDTSTAHTVFNIIGAIGFAIVGIATIVGTGGAALVIGVAASSVAAGANAGLYINDAIESDNEDERYSNIRKAGWSMLTIGTGGITSGASISIRVSEDGAKIFDSVVNVVSTYVD